MSLQMLTIGSQNGRSRQGSTETSPVFQSNSPHRAGTASSLPPYSMSPPRSSWDQEQHTQQAKTPSDLLGMTTQHRSSRSRSELESGRFKFLLEQNEGTERISHSPESSPNTLWPSKALAELSEREEDTMTQLDSRPGTQTEVAVESPGSSKINGTSPQSSRRHSRTLTWTSLPPVANSHRSSLSQPSSHGSRRASQPSPCDAVLEDSLDNLKGVKMFVFSPTLLKWSVRGRANKYPYSSYISKKSRISYHVSRMESWRDTQTRRRLIVIERPIGSSTQFICRGSSLQDTKSWLIL